LRVPIAIRAFYESYLWIPQTLLLTHPDLHPGLLRLNTFIRNHAEVFTVPIFLVDHVRPVCSDFVTIHICS
jgi:hypothetical protein